MAVFGANGSTLIAQLCEGVLASLMTLKLAWIFN